MAHFNEIVVKTAKVKGSTLEDIKSSLAAHYPDFVVQDIKEQRSEWEATLLKEISADEMARMAALPFEEEEEIEIEGPEEEDEIEEEDEEGIATSSPASDDTEEGEETKSTGSEIKHIEDLLLELNKKVQDLQEKAGLVDNIHEQTKPFAQGPAPEEIGPTAPEGGNPLGVGLPGKQPRPTASTKIAYASIEQDGFEFSMSEVFEAMQEKYPDHNIIEMKKDAANNRYIARLESK